MNRVERIYKINQLLQARRVVPLAAFLTELDVSRATFKRDLAYLRDRLHAPIVWDREAGGYRLAPQPAVGPAYALPGLWFSASEAYALLTAYKLFAEIEPGVLSNHIAPLQARIAELLQSSGHAMEEITRRVRILAMHQRRITPECFVVVAQALLERRRLALEAYNRARNETNARVVSPQRLVHYRDNWYLDAYCHWRRALRSFSLDTLQQVKVLPIKARDIPDKTLDAHYSSAYGIFSGKPNAHAVLRFEPARARWVAAECWHPAQKSEWLPDGSYRLTLPFSDARELVMDILRHGRSVVVEAPDSLRQMVAEEIAAMAASYARGDRST
ncbi:MAG: helix-turn-helix transcriptional regulator [Thiobacillaceae bacterium]